MPILRKPDLWSEEREEPNDFLECRAVWEGSGLQRCPRSAHPGRADARLGEQDLPQGQKPSSRWVPIFHIPGCKTQNLSRVMRKG